MATDSVMADFLALSTALVPLPPTITYSAWQNPGWVSARVRGIDPVAPLAAALRKGL